MTVQESAGASATPNTPAESSASDLESYKAVKASDVVTNEATKSSTQENKKPAAPKAVHLLIIEGPYPPTMFGLEAARVHCRFMMNRIVSEVRA